MLEQASNSYILIHASEGGNILAHHNAVRQDGMSVKLFPIEGRGQLYLTVAARNSAIRGVQILCGREVAHVETVQQLDVPVTMGLEAYNKAEGVRWLEIKLTNRDGKFLPLNWGMFIGVGLRTAFTEPQIIWTPAQGMPAQAVRL